MTLDPLRGPARGKGPHVIRSQGGVMACGNPNGMLGHIYGSGVIMPDGAAAPGRGAMKSPAAIAKPGSSIRDAEPATRTDARVLQTGGRAIS